MTAYPMIGSLCRVCQTGKLLPVLDARPDGITTSGIIGLPMSVQFIERLSCSDCHVCFETDLRGTDVESYLQEQAKDAMSRRQPKTCPRCGDLKFLSARLFPSKEHPFTPRPTIYDHEEHDRTYVHCSRCLLLIKVERSSWDKKMARLAPR